MFRLIVPRQPVAQLGLLSRTLHTSPRLLLLDSQHPTATTSSSPPSSSYPPPSLNSTTATRRTRPNPPASNAPPPPSPPPLHAQLTRKRITSVNELPKTFGRNQIIAVPDQVKRELEDVLAQFKAPVRFAFAYGSGVFRQQGYSDKDKPLLDFVFAVSHPSHWHAVNMAQHPDHYSLPMRLLGSDAVAWMQEKGLGAGVWFNVEVEVNGKILKYGTITVDALCRDMLDWETLYISGRTQKPVRILHDDARVRLANQVNLASALRTALLLLPENFNEVELFEEIAGLSYRGDFRMQVGENPLKVRNIVGAQLDSFRSLYGGLLKSFWKSVHIIGESPSHFAGHSGVRLLRQDVSVSQRASIARKLPVGLRDKVYTHYEREWNFKRAVGAPGAAQSVALPADEQALWERIVADDKFRDTLIQSIGEIVARPTFRQSLKGILSAGPLKSLRYIIPKLKKKFGAATGPAVTAPPKQDQ